MYVHQPSEAKTQHPLDTISLPDRTLLVTILPSVLQTVGTAVLPMQDRR